jgi:hypothetical protein
MVELAGTKMNEYTKDKDYDLVSVLYHALQGVENAGKYRQDAEREDSPEVADFMREVQEQNNRVAQRAKELLFKQKQL